MVKKVENKDEVLVTYVRVREIFHAYLKYQYGDLPVSLPESGRLYDVFATSLAPNPTMYRMNYSTFSQAAFDTSVSLSDEEIALKRSQGTSLPLEADRRKLIPFCLPHTVYVGRSLVHTNRYFQVTTSGYRQMSRIIEDEFWAKFIDFDRMFSLYCARVGTKYSQDESIEKFMSHIGMEVKFEDTFARYWRRKKELDRRSFCCYSNKEHTERLKAFFESDKK